MCAQVCVACVCVCSVRVYSVCALVWMCVSVCACAHVCVACVCVCVCACVCVQSVLNLIQQDVLMVYGANAETMKKICSVLAECAAFNSKGWIKLSTGPKTPSTDIDVYIKDTSAVLNNVSEGLLCLR